MADLSGSHPRRWIVSAGAAAAGVGVVAAAIWSLAYLPSANWFQSFTVVIYMLAAMAVAGIAGFIFAVPRARPDSPGGSGNPSPRTVRFEANSNLEQISDWLTKILVGAGLVQLTTLPDFLRSLGEYLGSSFGVTGPPISVAFVLYGFGIGFLFAYLWTRLRFRVVLESTEREAQDESLAEKIARGLEVAEDAASTAAGRPPSSDPERLKRLGDELQRFTEAVGPFQPLLWVDDNPGNNLEMIHTFQAAGVRVEVSVSTRDAHRKLVDNRYGLVITDARRIEDGCNNSDAGLQLLKLMVQLQVTTQAIVYTGPHGMKNAKALLAAGAIGVTSFPAELFELALRALAQAEPS